MKKEIIKRLTGDFESYANQTSNEIEFWFARDLQHLLGYTEWRNFTKLLIKRKLHMRRQVIRYQTILLTSTKWFRLAQEQNVKSRTLC